MKSGRFHLGALCAGPVLYTRAEPETPLPPSWSLPPHLNAARLLQTVSLLCSQYPADSSASEQFVLVVNQHVCVSPGVGYPRFCSPDVVSLAKS